MNASIDRVEGSTLADGNVRTTMLGSSSVDAEEERTLLGIRQARDLVLGKNRELIDKLAQAEDQIAELTYQRDDFMVARDVAVRKVAELTTEAESLRIKVSLLSEQHAALAEAEKIYVMARAEIEADLLTLVEERDEARETSRAHALEIDRLKAELATAQAATPQDGPGAAQRDEDARKFGDAEEANARFMAQQKKNIAALAEQLAAAQRARDESRREATQLAAERQAWQKQAGEEKAALEAKVTALEARLSSVAQNSSTAPAKPAPDTALAGAVATPAIAVVTPISDKEVRDAIAAAHLQLEALTVQPEKPELIAEFEATLQAISERTLGTGLDLIHHITTAGSDLARRLRATPAKVGALIPIFESAIEMLGWLGLRGRSAMLDLDGALVYAVDDDVDNCECLATAFEKVALQTKYSVRPEIAIEQIGAHACELIVLDVDLPGMDGFELHSRIRKMPAHAATPIIFLSGHMSASERLKELEGDNNQFVAKPYNLSELSLRVLTLIVETRLG